MRPALVLLPRVFATLVALTPIAGLVGGCAAKTDSVAEVDGQVGETDQALRACMPNECRSGTVLWACPDIAHAVSTPCVEPPGIATYHNSQGGLSPCEQVTYVCGCETSEMPTCAPGSCGTVSNECGEVDCGGCTAPATCGGGGTPHQCGLPPDCYPEPTCASACSGSTACLWACEIVCDS